MGMQTAYLNQPYSSGFMAPGASSNTVASYVIPLSPGAPASRPNYGANSMNASGGLGALPDIPPPSQLAPAVMGSSSATSAYNTSQSIPVSGPLPDVPPSAEIPPPHMVAPWVFLQRGQNPPPLPQQPYAQQKTPLPLSTQSKTPMPPPQPRQPQGPPRQQLPPPPPPQQPQEKKASPDLPNSGLSDATIKSLNERLESDDEGTRSEAALDFLKILERNPKLAEDSNYKAYIDAFSDKIIQDSPMVREPLLIALQLGYLPHVSDTQYVIPKLEEISNKEDITGEREIARGILDNIRNGTLPKRKPPDATQNKGATTPPGAIGSTPPGAIPQNAMGQSQPGATPPSPMQTAAPASAFSSASGFTPTGLGQQGQAADALAKQNDATKQQLAQQQADLERQQQEKIEQQKLEQEKAEQQALEKQQEELKQQQAAMNQPTFGSRLNIISPQQAVQGGRPSPQAGQRLNIQEG